MYTCTGYTINSNEVRGGGGGGRHEGWVVSRPKITMLSTVSRPKITTLSTVSRPKITMLSTVSRPKITTLSTVTYSCLFVLYIYLGTIHNMYIMLGSQVACLFLSFR